MANAGLGKTAPLRQAFKSSIHAIGAIVVFSCALNLIILISPLYMMQIYNRVLPHKSEETLFLLTGLVVVLLFVFSILDGARSLLMVRISGRLEQQLSKTVFEAVFYAAAASHGRSGQQALRDFDTVRQCLVGTAALSLFDVPWTPLFLMLTFVFHPLLGTVALCGTVVLLMLALLNDRVTRGKFEQAREIGTANGAFVEASLRNIEALRAMGMLGTFRSLWGSGRMEALRLQTNAADRAGILLGVSRAMRLLLQSLLLGVGAWLAIQGAITPGVIIASSVIMSRGLAPLEQAIAGWRHLAGGFTAYKRLNILLTQMPTFAKRTSLPHPKGNIAVENLVAWPPGSPTPTLRGVSFVLPAGRSLGVIGPSGSGKSTLVRQLIGVTQAHAGIVRLDGADVHAWNRDELGPCLGYLPQDVELFDGTVAANIARFGDIDSEAIVAASQRAGVHELILALPNAYETVIGPGGCALSGGQRQRIGLARALYRDPAIVVLDEPNAHLDQAGDEALEETLGELKRTRRTVVIVSHRPKILRHVDDVLLLKDGRLVLMKSRQELSAESERLAELSRRRIREVPRHAADRGSLSVSARA